ncbi:MAG: hypothetical protein ABI852_12895 [Gemmatimonadaceae bacterium]
MPENTEVKRARDVLNAEIEFLKGHAATSVNQCDVAKLIAVMNNDVLNALMSHVARGDQPRGVTCIGSGRVLFAFGCPPNTICLVPRDVLVIVDLAKKQVMEIVDPYDAQGLQAATFNRTTPVSSPLPPGVRIVSATESQPISGRVRTLAVSLNEALHGAASLGATYTVTITVPDMPMKDLQSGNNRYGFNGDSAVLTLPAAGTYRFFLTVSDPSRPGQPYSFTVSTSSGTNFSGASALDANGANTVGFDVTVP